MNSSVDCVVVGAGLSGLACARLLLDRGLDVVIVEARPRVGGRLLAARDKAGRPVGDLGATWVWPEYQPVLPQWLSRYGLSTFAQFVDGLALVEGYGPEPVARMHLPGQVGQRRIEAGPHGLIDAIRDSLGPGRLLVDAPVKNIVTHAGGVDVAIAGSFNDTLRASQIVIAVPPRIALGTIAFEPALPAGIANALAALPTWMAAHAKFVAVYERAFWRGQGLSGRLASRQGPVVEMHDHCASNGDIAALVGFVGWPAPMRNDQGAAQLEAAIGDQLACLFGSGAPALLSLHLQDWALEEWTATPADISDVPAHPLGAPQGLSRSLSGRGILFAGAELGADNPGLIAGALEAAEAVSSVIEARQRA